LRQRPHPKADHARLGAHFRAVRLKCGTTQEELAARLGQPQSFVAKIEAGERQLTVLELVDACVVFGVSPGEFLAGLID